MPAAVAAARACGTILKRIGFERFQTRFKAPESCVAQLTARLVGCAEAADPNACLDARVEALVREYTGDEPLLGGVYTTRSGARVRVLSSEESGADEDARRSWAELLDRFVHGQELDRDPPRVDARGRASRVRADSSRLLLAADGDDRRAGGGNGAVERGVARRARVRSPRRLQPPEPALAGRRARSETVGDAHGDLRPLRRADRFRPDAQALRLVERDVLEPWRGPTKVVLAGRGSRSFRVATPLDGTVGVRLAAPAGSVYRVSAQRLVCGQRNVVVRVRHLRGGGPFRLTVSRP